MLIAAMPAGGFSPPSAVQPDVSVLIAKVIDLGQKLASLDQAIAEHYALMRFEKKQQAPI